MSIGDARDVPPKWYEEGPWRSPRSSSRCWSGRRWTPFRPGSPRRCRTSWCWWRPSRRTPTRTCSGIYEGVPLTERDHWYAGVLPDRITIFRGPITRMCDTYEEVVEEVRVTVVHEVAHHFGIGDDELHDLGYG